MAGIFVSYRRDDAGGHAGRIHERLRRYFGNSLIFIDIEDIPPGQNFVEVLDNRIRSCDVFVVVIGNNWLTIKDRSGRRRIEDPADFVRMEITAALERNVPIIPVLVGGASMPSSHDLPSPIQRLAYINAFEVYNRIFDDSVSQLIRILLKSVKPNRFTCWIRRVREMMSAALRVTHTAERIPISRWVAVVAAAGCLVALLSVMSSIYGWHTTRTQAESVFPAIPTVNLPEELPVLPYVDECPAPVTASVNRVVPADPGESTGPRNPHPDLKLDSSANYRLLVRAAMNDGTLYLTDLRRLWAVRQGKVDWGFEGDHNPSFVGSDGNVYGEDICLNREGKGGRVRRPGSYIQTLRASASKVRYSAWVDFSQGYGSRLPQCMGPAVFEPLKKWFAPLSNDCETVGTDGYTGTTYARAVDGRLYAITAYGQLLWHYALPCRQPSFITARNDTVFFTCSQSSPHGQDTLYVVSNGAPLWKFVPGGTMRRNGFAVDQTGTVYIAEEGERAHLYGIGMDGRVFWTFPLGQFDPEGLQIASGRLFLAGRFSRSRGSSMVCFSDHGR